MIRTLVICLAAGLAALPVAVSAQIEGNRKPTGFTLRAYETDHRTVNAATPSQVTLAMTARCLADNRAEHVRAYLASVPGSEAEIGAYEAFQERIGPCMPRIDFSEVGNLQRGRGTLSLGFDHGSLRGALAEAIMREEDTIIDTGRLALGDEGMYVAERFHGQRSEIPARVFSLGFAGCVMGYNAERIEALLSTSPASTEERDAIMAMVDSFGGCVMEGQTLKIDPSTLRNQMAEVVYYAMSGSAT